MVKMKPKKQAITIELPNEEYDQLVFLAEEYNTSKVAIASALLRISKKICREDLLSALHPKYSDK